LRLAPENGARRIRRWARGHARHEWPQRLKWGKLSWDDQMIESSD
jgi:hypothetical protein